MNSEISKISSDYNRAKKRFKTFKAHLNALRKEKITDTVISSMGVLRRVMMDQRKLMLKLCQKNREAFMKQAAADATKFSASNKIIPSGNFTVNYTSAIELLKCLTDYCKKMQQVPAESRVKAVISFKSV